MYFAITGAIYLGGAGAVILGGLYWKRGTAAGTWAAMILGSVCSVSGIILQSIVWPHLPTWKKNYPTLFGSLPEAFPLTGMEMAFIFAVVALLAYVVVSLMTKPDKELDFDQLFHHGKYAVDDKKTQNGTGKWRILAKFGIGEEFTLSDKIVAVASILLTLFWVFVFIVGNIIHSKFGISKEVWGKWWAFYLIINMAISIVVAVWLFIGGLSNFRDLICLLKEKRKDSLDDGYVIGHKRLSEVEDKDTQQLVESQE